MADILKNEPLSIEEITGLTKDNILDDVIFARLFFFRETIGEFETLDLYHALCNKARELQKLSLLREKYKIFKKQADLALRKKEQQEQQEKRKLQRVYLPSWIDENNKIDEVAFIDEFINSDEEFHCINGTMYGYNGCIDDGKIKQQIQEKIKPYIKRNLADTTTRILRALKTECTTEKPALDDSKIHVQNGYYNLADNLFHSDMTAFTLNRLNVWYNQEYKEPLVWLKYLSELLEEDDIQTLQEYMGYCLIPTKKVQKALYIFGNGEEGKSIIKSVISAMFAKSYSLISIKDIAENPYTMATLDNKLVVVDDDAQTSAFKETGTYKILVTNSDPIQVNPKFKSIYETIIYARFIILSNQPVRALYDHSDGFLRRQLILRTKDKPTDRVNDHNLTDKILKELDYIFLWCLEGLKRLVSNGYNIHESADSKANLEELKEISSNVIKFAKNETFIKFTGNMNDTISTQELYRHYRQWCDFNEETPLHKDRVSLYFNRNSKMFNIKKDGNIVVQGKRCNGFKGIKIFELY